MKVRVYDGGKKYADRYTVYFPYPKRMQSKDCFHGLMVGCMVGSNFHVDEWSGKVSIVKFIWEDAYRYQTINGTLGRKVNLDKLPKEYREWVLDGERRWNNFVADPSDPKANKEWMEW